MYQWLEVALSSPTGQAHHCKFQVTDLYHYPSKRPTVHLSNEDCQETLSSKKVKKN